MIDEKLNSPIAINDKIKDFDGIVDEDKERLQAEEASETFNIFFAETYEKIKYKPMSEYLFKQAVKDAKEYMGDQLDERHILKFFQLAKKTPEGSVKSECLM